MSPKGQPAVQMCTVVHFGNKPGGEGGIASVIRGHLRRFQSGFEVSSATTYDQDANGFIRKNMPLVYSLNHLLALPRTAIVHIHLSQRGSLLREGLIAGVAKLRQHPVVATIHGSSLSSSSTLTALGLRLLLGCVDIVHGFSDAYKQRLSVPSSKWEFVPNDVTVPQAVAPSKQREQVVVFAGQVGHRKGIELLLDAWSTAYSTGWRLVVAGVVPKNEEAFVFGRQWPEGAEYLGALSHRDLLKLLSSAMILVQPSRAEAFPMSVCEALANGCAVIGTRVGGMGELLEAARQTTVDPSAASVAGELQGLMADASRLEEQAKAGHQYAQSHLSTTVVTSEWARIYTDVIEKSYGQQTR